jgi:hypothetical protein
VIEQPFKILLNQPLFHFNFSLLRPSKVYFPSDLIRDQRAHHRHLGLGVFQALMLRFYSVYEMFLNCPLLLLFQTLRVFNILQSLSLTVKGLTNSGQGNPSNQVALVEEIDNYFLREMK